MERIKHMETGTWFSAMWGAIGGTTYYIFVDAVFFMRLLEAGFTAFFCGFVGAAGKYYWDKWKKRKKNV
jgi:hypothetical protein